MSLVHGEIDGARDAPDEIAHDVERRAALRPPLFTERVLKGLPHQAGSGRLSAARGRRQPRVESIRHLDREHLHLLSSSSHYARFVIPSITMIALDEYRQGLYPWGP